MVDCRTERLKTYLLLFLFFSACPPFIFAEESAEQKSWWQQVDAHLFVSTAYVYNFQSPSSKLNNLRVFDFDHNSFKIDVAELALEKVAEPHQVGFRLDLAAGASIPKITAASGLFRDPQTGESEDVDLQQAYISYNAGPVRFDFGKHVTHTGAEVIEGFDGFNDHYSRSFLFGFAIPFTHTGLRVNWPFHQRASAVLLVVNGWDNVKDNNGAKSYGGQLSFQPASPVTFYLNYLGGPERNENDEDKRHLFDIVAVWKPHPKASVMLNYDYGTEENAAGDGADGTWKGVAAYFRLALTEELALAFRGEQFDDEDGVRTGSDQRLREFTITMEVRPRPHFLLRGEIRWDDSNQPVFLDEDQPDDRQTTAALNAIYLF